MERKNKAMDPRPQMALFDICWPYFFLLQLYETDFTLGTNKKYHLKCSYDWFKVDIWEPKGLEGLKSLIKSDLTPQRAPGV